MSTTAEERATPIRSGRGWSIAVGVLVVLVAIAAFFYWRHQVALNARMAQAQARIDVLRSEIAEIERSENRYSTLENKYDALSSDGTKAGTIRHDNDDIDVRKSEAKRELKDVNSLQDMVPEMRTTLSEIADAYAAVVGDGAVSSFRSSADQLTQMHGLGLNRWWRAITDINDSIVNNIPAGENIEQLYDESGDYDTRAQTQGAELGERWQHLQKLVRGRVAEAKQNLADIH